MLRMTRKVYEAMVQDAKGGFPLEACGLLAGADQDITAFYQMSNTDQSPVSYLMDPKEQFQVMKQMRGKGEKMLGVYHSHVATEAYPSSTDIRLAFYPEIHYVLVSLLDQERPKARAFRIEDGKVREDSLEVIS